MSKKILITGASGGLGEGMARHFAKHGATLVLTARRSEQLEALAVELRGAGAKQVLVRRLDVTDYGSVPRLLREVAAELGGLDVVVANAGIGGAAPVGKGRFELARKVIETNLLGAMATIDAAAELFLEQGHGQVVGISSVAAVRGLPMQGAYSASKSGLSRYLESLRAEVSGRGIVVTDLAPGFIDTEINRHLANRPFVVSAERGTEEMVRIIEAGSAFAYVPRLPWTLLAQLLKLLPARLLAVAR